MKQLLHILILLSLCPGLTLMAADSELSRRMAAEIIEQAAQGNRTYRETLLDVAKALRAEQMSVGEAKDLLTLAAACQELGASRNGSSAAAEQLDQALDPTAQPGTGKPEHQPEMLDIDKLLEEEKDKEDPVFENLEREGDNADDPGYNTGIAGKKLPWNSDEKLAEAKKDYDEKQNRDKERPSLKQDAADAVEDKLISRRGKIGRVTLVRPGLDGQPQVVLINVGSKDGLKNKQQLLIHRDGKALVKAVVNRVKDFEAFAIIMPDTWAVDATREIKVNDTIQKL